MKTTPKTKLVMFDYDGVIMDSNHCPMEFYDLLAQHLGTRKFKSWDECRAILEANYRDSLLKLGVIEPERFAKAQEIFYKNHELWKDLELFPNVKEMLIELKTKGYQLAIVSNNESEVIIPDLKKHKILHLFDHIIDRKVGVKPNPDPLLHCLRLTKTYADQAVMIDDMDGGLIAAKKIKIKKAIGVSYGYQLPERLHMADVIVHKPEEIPREVE